MRKTGWNPPTIKQTVRALRSASPEAGDNVLAGITAANFADNSALTCDLDQGQLGSCAANGPAQAMYMAMKAAGIPAFVLSRLWLYYSFRFLEDSVNEDAGGNIGDAYRILALKGVPHESTWPYDISKFTVNPGPTPDMDAYDSRGAIGVNYHPVSSTGDLLIWDIEKASTAQFGIVFGSYVTDEFCSSQPNGIIHVPKAGTRPAGGHCQTIVGFDHANECAIVKNSWGSSFGDPNAPEGCSLIGYDYLIDPFWGISDVWINLLVPKGLAL